MQMDPKEEESSLMQPLLQEQQHIQAQEQHIHDEQQQHTHLMQQLLQQQQLLEQQLEQLVLHQQLHDGEPHLQQQCVQHILKILQELRNHMRKQHGLLQQQQPGTQPRFRVHFYQTTSMVFGLVVTLYVALMGTLVARDLFDGQRAIAIISSVLFCYSVLTSYGLLGYHYRVNQDPVVHNRYVRLVTVGSYLTAVASLALLFVAIIFTGTSDNFLWG